MFSRLKAAPMEFCKYLAVYFLLNEASHTPIGRQTFGRSTMPPIMRSTLRVDSMREEDLRASGRRHATRRASLR